MASEGVGVKAVVGELIEGAEVPAPQASLFPAADIAALGHAAQFAQVLRKRGPGRPLGAQNRRTQAFRDYVVARGGGEHPADGLIEVYTRSVHVLAAELRCTTLEAMELQIACRKAMLEYVEGKMPVRVDLNSTGGITLVMEGMSEAGKQGDGDNSLIIDPFIEGQSRDLDKGDLDSES